MTATSLVSLTSRIHQVHSDAEVLHCFSDGSVKAQEVVDFLLRVFLIAERNLDIDSLLNWTELCNHILQLSSFGICYLCWVSTLMKRARCEGKREGQAERTRDIMHVSWFVLLLSFGTNLIPKINRGLHAKRRKRNANSRSNYNVTDFQKISLVIQSY